MLRVSQVNVDLLGGVIAIRKLLRADPGTTYEFVVDRAGEKRRLTLKLSKLL